MTDSKKIPFWYWIVSALAFIWNAMGVDQYIGQAYVTERWKSNLTTEQIDAAKDLPAWVTAAFAIAVFGGLLGSLGLLLKKHWSRPLFLISFIAVVVQMGYLFYLGYTENLPMSISIILFSAFLVWFSGLAPKKNWY